MSDSQIHLIDTDTRRAFPAAPQGTVLSSSVALGWQGITAELHSLPKSEYPEHYVQGHRLAIMRRGKPITYEWKQDGNWKSKQTHSGTFFLQSHGELNAPRWFQPFEIIAIALEPSFVARCFQDTINCDLLRFKECRAEYDPHKAQFANHFEAELVNNSYGGTLYGESLALAFSLLYRSQGQLQSMGLDSFDKQDEVVGGVLPLKAAPALNPEDIADTATFLASDRAKFISGEVVDVALGYNAAYTA